MKLFVGLKDFVRILIFKKVIKRKQLLLNLKNASRIYLFCKQRTREAVASYFPI